MFFVYVDGNDDDDGDGTERKAHSYNFIDQKYLPPGNWLAYDCR